MDYITAPSVYVTQVHFVAWVTALLFAFVLTSKGQRCIIDLASLVTHEILRLRNPIKNKGTGVSLPTAKYRWPNGQGDAAKFLHGKQNSLLWRERYGRIYQIWSGFTPEVVLTVPEHIQTVFRDSDKHFKAINNNSGYLLSQLLGDCVGLVSHGNWKRIRSATESFFTRDASKGYTYLVVSRTRRHMRNLEMAPSVASNYISPAQDLKMLPFWIVAEILYGGLTPEMESELEALAPIREHLFKYVIAGGIARFSWSKYLPTAANRMLRDFRQRWTKFNKQAWATAADRGARQAPIVLMYEAIRTGTCTESEILQTLDEMLYANLDVTLGGLTWNLVQLAAHEDVQTRLLAEVTDARTVATDNDKDSLSTYLNSSTTYLQAVISESSRLRPLAAFSVPQAAPTPRVLDGYMIPAGTNFIIDSYSLNQRNTYWGHDTSQFRPERFLDRKPTEARYNFWRFGFGPRQCLGKYVADLIIRSLLVELVQNFDLGLEAKEEEWKRDLEVWIDHPDLRLTCKKKAVRSSVACGSKLRPAVPFVKLVEQTSGFQINEKEINDRLTPMARRLLRNYAEIDPDQVVPHVASIQRKAYKTCPPSCMPFIGYIRFLEFPLRSHHRYPEIKSRLAAHRTPTPQAFLDLGCCFGQDMRQLALDGADLSQSLGVDIEQSFLDMGYELFGDKQSTMKFEAADIFDNESKIWRNVKGKVDITHASNFFHTFCWDDQITAARRIAQLLRTQSDNGRSLVVGCTVGSTHPREVAIVSEEKTSFCHDASTFRRLWDQVGEGLGMKFRTTCRLEILDEQIRVGPLAEETMRMLIFDVEVRE